jgi:alpha-L-fucosidase 2
MLIQSHNGVVRLLPALPKAWKDGEFTGLRARGGFEIDAKWKDGKITSFTVRAVANNEDVIIIANGQEYPLSLKLSKEKTIML